MKEFIWKELYPLAICSTLLACAAVPDEAPPSESLAQQRQEISTTPAPEGQGYVHSATRSRFRIGATVAQKSEFGLSKIVGSEGVFATVEQTGWSMGIPNADALLISAGRAKWSAESHNQAVLSYFKDAGLSAVQLAGVSAHANIHAGGAVGTAEADLTTNPVPAGYTSCLLRAIANIPVPDSFAWAGLDEDRDVVEEGVYWPEIPAPVIAEAKAMRDELADPAALMSFRIKVGDTTAEGEVVIRHSPGVSGTAFQAAVAYDRIDGNVVHHFDSSGREFKMAAQNVSRPAQQKAP